MATIHDGELQAPSHSDLFVELDKVTAILGNASSKTAFWPGLETSGFYLFPHEYGSELSYRIGISVTNMISGTPVGIQQLPSGINAYVTNAGLNQIFTGGAGASSSFVGAAMAMGMWIKPLDTTSVTLISKYDATAAADREYLWELDSNGDLSLTLFDETNDGTEIAVSDTAITANVWTFVCTVWDGDDADPSILHYLNGVVDNDGTSTEAGTYATMVDGATLFAVGAQYDTDNGSPHVNQFDGAFALPFIASKNLSAAEVLDIYNITRKLIGV